MGEMNDAGQWVGWAGSAGIGLALGLGVLYLILRGTAWSPGRGDPIRAARTHAMITALISFFAAGTSGLSRLATAAPGLTWFDGLSIILGPVLGLVLVYVVAQYTWPRQTGAVRTARLRDRRPADLLPRYLTAFTALIMVGTLSVMALAWTTPALEARQNDESGWFEPGVRAGEAFAPWLLLALVLTALGFLVVLTTIARRPILNGLHPHDDDLVRRIAVNRALRTAAVMAIGIGQAGFNAWAAGTSPSGQPLDQWMAGVSITLMLVLLFWRSPHVSELGSRTVPGLEGYDAGRSPRVGASPSPPGTARAVLRLRLDGATLAWILAAPTAALVAFFLWATPADGAEGGSVILWSALPCAAALLILGFTEFGVRRGHCPATEPATTGKSSTWPVLALELAVLLAAVWCVLCLATPVPQPGLAAALAAATAGFVLLSAALTRLALRRPALGRATGAQDAAIRTGGADRLLAVGAAGVFAVTGAAVLAGVQVWNGFLTSAVLDLGINDLPDGLLLTRALLLFLLFGLLVACVIAPAPAVPGVPPRPRAERVERAVHAEQAEQAEQGGSLR